MINLDSVDLTFVVAIQAIRQLNRSGQTTKRKKDLEAIEDWLQRDRVSLKKQKLVNKNKPKFKYINGLGRDYDTSIKNIGSIMFSLVKTGEIRKLFEFKDKVTEAVAIRCAEKYLSQDICPIYYQYVLNFNKDQYFKRTKLRGFLLPNTEIVETYLDGHILHIYIKNE